MEEEYKDLWYTIIKEEMNMAELKVPENQSVSIGDMGWVPGVNPYGPAVSNPLVTKGEVSDIQDLRDRHDDNKRDIDKLKDVTQTHDIRICQQENEIYKISEQVKEALMIVKYPGLIANRVLDKVDSFIAKHKKMLTDNQGLTTEVVEVSHLNEMVKQLREVIKNDKNRNIE